MGERLWARNCSNGGKRWTGVTINEIYGQTEVNLVVGNCAEIMEIRPGSMGKPIPAESVEIVDESGAPVPDGHCGEVPSNGPIP